MSNIVTAFTLTVTTSLLAEFSSLLLCWENSLVVYMKKIHVSMTEGIRINIL